MAKENVFSPGSGVTLDVDVTRQTIENSEMYAELGLGFLPLRALLDEPGEFADDIVVLMGTKSALPIHIHPKQHHAETWRVLCGNGIAYIGEIRERRITDDELVAAWNESEETNIVDGVLEVTSLEVLFPGKVLHIPAGSAHGCENSNPEPLMFYASLLNEEGDHGCDPSDRRLRAIPQSVSMQSLRRCLDPVSQRLFSLS